MIRFLFAPLRYAPDEPEFTGNGSTYKLPENPRFTERLGKKLLVLDLDTRRMKSHDAWQMDKFDWQKVDHLTGGPFNHYTYAMIHGYDYKFLHPPSFSDRKDTWVKPSAFAKLIEDYEFIVFLDSDAVFHEMHLPMEWLFNFWKIEPQHSLTLALDPWDEKNPTYNADRFNRPLGNTGFMVVQKNDATHEILKAWHECPDDTRYPGCSKWKKPKFHEQSALGNYIRYDYEENIKELPCAYANGYPEVDVQECRGLFMRHYWFEKSRVKDDLTQNVMRAFTTPLQRAFSLNLGGFVQKSTENTIP